MLLKIAVFTDQFEAMQDELERRREECILLKTILADRDHPVNPSFTSHTELINEDGELLMAYETQKTLTRFLFCFYKLSF